MELLSRIQANSERLFNNMPMDLQLTVPEELTVKAYGEMVGNLYSIQSYFILKEV